jgi:hypothetical protein
VTFSPFSCGSTSGGSPSGSAGGSSPSGGSSSRDTGNSSIDFGGRSVVHDEILREDTAFSVILIVARIAFSRAVGSLDFGWSEISGDTGSYLLRRGELTSPGWKVPLKSASCGSAPIAASCFASSSTMALFVAAAPGDAGS